MASQVSPKGERSTPPWTSLVASRQSASPRLGTGPPAAERAGAAPADLASAARRESLSLVMVLSSHPEMKNPDQRAGVRMGDLRPFSGFFYVARKPVGSNHHEMGRIGASRGRVKRRGSKRLAHRTTAAPPPGRGNKEEARGRTVDARLGDPASTSGEP